MQIYLFEKPASLAERGSAIEQHMRFLLTNCSLCFLRHGPEIESAMRSRLVRCARKKVDWSPRMNAIFAAA
jgi:hypothetical protein